LRGIITLPLPDWHLVDYYDQWLKPVSGCSLDILPSPLGQTQKILLERSDTGRTFFSILGETPVSGLKKSSFMDRYQLHVLKVYNAL